MWRQKNLFGEDNSEFGEDIIFFLDMQLELPGRNMIFNFMA